MCARMRVDSRVVKYHKVKGVTYEVIDDEIEMEEDPKGELKVDSKGRLLGGASTRPLSALC